jgi:hypothetical protein
MYFSALKHRSDLLDVLIHLLKILLDSVESLCLLLIEKIQFPNRVLFILLSKSDIVGKFVILQLWECDDI